MQVAITARHIELTEAMKAHVEERLQKLERLVDPVVSASIVLSVEKYRHSAEITLQGNGFNFHGADVTGDLYAAVDNVVDKLRRQIERQKARASSAKVRQGKRLAEAVKSQPEPSEAREGTVPEEEDPGSPPRRGEAPPVVKTSNVPIKPMTVAEASLQLLSKGYKFFVFRNALTEEINVVYLLEDGQIGLITPVRP